MTLSDPNSDFEVTAFVEVQYLGPDWSYVPMSDIGPDIRLRIGLGLSGPSMT